MFMQSSSPQRPRLRLRRPFHHWVTIAVSQTCIMFFLAVMLTVEERGISRADALSRWGGMGDGLEVWQGEWWRIWVTQLHHDDLLHLAGNLWCFLFFGRLMELRMRKSEYILFLLASAGYGGVLQTVIGPSFVGISGVVSAQMGWLIAERERDSRLRRQFRDGPVFCLVCLLLLGIPLEWSETMPIGNAAHLGGAVFGMLWGMSRAVFHSPALRKSVRLAAMLLLIPAVDAVTQPSWNPEYYWAMADRTDLVHRKIQYFKRGLQRLPGNLMLNQQLAFTCFRNGELLNAWDAILSAVETSPADEKTLRMAQLIGQSIQPELPSRSPPRNQQSILVEHFGDQASAWEQLLLKRSTLAQTETIRPSVRPAPLPNEIEFQFPRPLQDPEPQKKLPLPNPDADGSAEEGSAA